MLLDDDDGPLLLPSHLQLGDVRLVLPPDNDGDDDNDLYIIGAVCHEK